jgi:predicted acylesterase/phospholipase RssA
MLASSIGGYLAGRLRSRWIGVHSDEVYFRDTAHGFIAWAFASVLGAILLASPATSVISGSAAGLSQGAATAAGQSSGPMDGYVDTLMRSDTPASGAQNASGGNDSRGEMVRLFTSSFRSGSELKLADRDYISKVVAARTGLSQADADKRVNEVVTQAKADIDATRKATAQLAFWLTASLLLGAFCASLAATEGGGLRDGTWGSKGNRSRR